MSIFDEAIFDEAIFDVDQVATGPLPPSGGGLLIGTPMIAVPAFLVSVTHG